MDTAISGDGRFFAATAGDGVRLWWLNDPRQPTVLATGDYGLPGRANGNMDFSSDGKRLLLMKGDASTECFDGTRPCAPVFAEAWEVPSGTRIPVPHGLVARTPLLQAAFTSDANTVATISALEGPRERIEVRDFTTGRLRYTSTTVKSGDAELQAGGEVLLTYDTTTSYTQALGAGPGPRTELLRGGVGQDATTRYDVHNPGGFSDPGITAGGYAEPTLTDLRTGQSYRTRIPTSGDAPATYDGIAAVPRAGGGLTVLVPVGSTLMAVRAEPSGAEQFRSNLGTYSLSPDSRFVAQVSAQRLEVLDASRTRYQSAPLPLPAKGAEWRATWTADSKRIVVWDAGGNLYQSYSVRDLGDSVPLVDVVPGAKELDGVRELRGGEVDAVAALQGSEIVLLTVDGRLASIDAADAAVRTRPFLVHPAPNWERIGTDRLTTTGQLIARPGHSGQVAVVTRTGTQSGEILLWDVRAPRLVHLLKVPPLGVPNITSRSAPVLAFDEDGSHLALRHNEGQVGVWDVDRRKELARSAPRTSNDALVGFGPDDSIVMHRYEKHQLQFHGLAGDGTSYTLPVSGNEWYTGFVRGHRLTVDTGRLRQTFDLRPDAQFRTLCAAAARDYTRAERKLLPDGAPSEPCA
ncbi:hypothetical protein AB0E04_40955 [Streptomyces sp. NPDC048251]|uniref:hypothetical protein n=1 Tax=Streptomyces sp. NPDC048251 TaxID=3154501 RepID=UPI0034333BAB